MLNDAWGVLHSGIAVDHQRRLLMIDSPNNQTRLEPGATDGSVFNGDSTIASWTRSKNSPNTFVFGSLAVPDKDNGYMYAKARLYRLTIWDNNQKVREYVPRVVNGVAGLYDLVNGGNLLTASGLAVSGCGHEGEEEWIIRPQGAVLRKGDAAAVISAGVVGAQYYRWKKNGESISGGTDGSLSVEWAKGGATDTYTVTPVYSVFGEEVEGAAVAVAVENIPQGLLLFIK
jgi:hypothetical protein